MNQNTVPQRKGQGRDDKTLLRLVRVRRAHLEVVTAGAWDGESSIELDLLVALEERIPLTRSAVVTLEAIGLIIYQLLAEVGR